MTKAAPPSRPGIPPTHSRTALRIWGPLLILLALVMGVIAIGASL